MLGSELAILSERGGRDYNEDACGHWQSTRHLVCVLADGAGGHGGGDIAARLAVERLLGAFACAPALDGARLLEMVRDTNHAILDERRPGSRQQDMHTTVVCLVIDLVEHRAYWAHAGDSRLYWFREGHIVRRTRDHSLVQSLVDAGMLAPEKLREHPQRSELRSALGTQPDELEVSVLEQAEEVAPGDIFLLCSDGLWEHADDAVLEAELAAAQSARAWLDSLGQHVDEATRHKPRHDNFSALAVWLSVAPAL